MATRMNAADSRVEAHFARATRWVEESEQLRKVSGAKQSQTRAARVEKHVPTVLAGRGLRDRR